MQAAFKTLLKDAKVALKATPPSVMEKTKLPPSGDKHDYMTIAPYFWPDSAKTDGLPYIRHDGKVNPDSRTDVYDRKRLSRMAGSTRTLTLAYYFTGKELYAQQAARSLQVWFLDPATRMNPNLNFAQAIPGKNTGRGIGIIEGRNLVEAIDSAGLLTGSTAWTHEDNDALKKWAAAYLDWLLTSSNGLDEARATNNHGTLYDGQVMRLALILDRKDLAKMTAETAKTKRISLQIDAQGKQPLELERTKSLSYSRLNLEGLFEIATMSKPLGVDLWNYQTADGRSIRKALDFLLPYLADPEKKWPYSQIEPIHPADFAPLLLQAQIIYQDSVYGNALAKLGDVSKNPMILLHGVREGAAEILKMDRDRILKAATAALAMPPLSITEFRANLSEGGANDFYSNGDYWWPDPGKPDGLPYLRRDGETNPGNFDLHRLAVCRLRDAVAALGAAYRLTGEEHYADKAAAMLRVFFLDPDTRMNPHLQYAQAIPGVTPGRGIGIIDTLHLVEIPMAVEAMDSSHAFPREMVVELRKWFADYLCWMLTSKNGKDEAEARNNHSVAFWLQAAVFARFTGDGACLAECRRRFKEVFVPQQMALDGSFPLELARTKPYGYSIFQLDNMATLCQVLSTPGENLWNFQLQDGRGIQKAIEYLYPYLADKSTWPLKPDVQAWDSWPARQSNLLFAGLALGKKKYMDLWKTLPPDPADPEVRRNIAITQPALWVK